MNNNHVAWFGHIFSIWSKMNTRKREIEGKKKQRGKKKKKKEQAMEGMKANEI